jgi:hypothetical protein
VNFVDEKIFAFRANISVERYYYDDVKVMRRNYSLSALREAC